jgi:hypothetical protein
MSVAETATKNVGPLFNRGRKCNGTLALVAVASLNVGISVVKSSPEYPRHKVQLDLSNGDVSRFKKTLGP